MPDLAGDVVVVTGASRGLGRSMSLRFLAEGASVVLVARDSDALSAVAGRHQGETLAVPADVRHEADVTEVFDRTRERFGRLDTLVNNAGVGLVGTYGQGKETADVDTDEWDRILDVNLRGAFLCARAALPILLDRGTGNLVNVTSTFATEPKAGWAPYVSSKFGLLGLTRTMALEYRESGVNVNSLHPGGKVATRFWDHLPEEERDDVRDADVMNDAAVHLASQGPDGITGEHHDAPGWERRLE